MSKKARISFRWQCPHCEHRDRVTFRNFTFEMPRYYSAEWVCEHCDKKSLVEWDLRVHGWYDKKKKFELKKIKKKRNKKGRDKVEKKDDGNKKDSRGYVNKGLL
jgi:hypothetical protein